MPKRGRLLYFALAILFALSFSYRVREIADRVELLLHPEEHARNPFGLDWPENDVVGVEPEAQAAGIQKGDTLLAFADRPYKGAVDFYLPMRIARAGEQVHAQFRTEDGMVKDTSIRLQPYDVPPTTGEALQQIVLNVMPVFCMLLGFWVAAVRIRDPRAWIFVAMMISFAEMNGGLARTWLGHDDFFQPIGYAYQQFAANFTGAAMFLFGIYFPQRFAFDRRWPWVKWILIGPILLHAIQLGASDALIGHHYRLAMMIDRFLLPPGLILTIQMLGISGFFLCIAHKTFAETNPDARRRLFLLYGGSTISMMPVLLVIIGNVVTGQPALRRTPALTVSAFLMIVGFPLTMAYVIVVERAMDVRVVIRQGIQYLLASKGVTVVRLVLSAAIIVVAVVGFEGMTASRRMLVVAGGVFAIILIRELAARLRVWIDRRFFREAYDAEQILIDLADKVRSIVETGPLLETVTHRISESLHVPRVGIMLDGGGTYRLAYAVGYETAPDLEIPINNPNVEQTLQEKLGAELVLPLSLNQKALGLLSLGPKRSEEPYTKADVRLLGSVATQTGLALENSRLTSEIAAEVAQRERMNREIEIAREVQERLFPQDLPAVEGLDYAGYCRPASGVGGDYYDFVPLPDGKLGIAIGDISGKGIPAALLMAALRASLRGQTIQRIADLGTLMSNVNKLIYESSASNRYATFFYGEYDPTTRNLAYVNGGHNPPLVLRQPGEVLRLEAGGPVVGLLPMFTYEQGSITLRPGDLFIAFTDGISEAMNSAEEEWGEPRLIESAWQLYGNSAAQILDRLLACADAFAAGAKQHDDMTLIVARVS